ncbi:hypothetical protein GCM10008927_22310 [Amylibacter ulvae]|uniref:OmpA-like domain-containing protein n=1 Tax=Paramylibacter ulvae TaxID=1651968 RepID=A0ABQ3D320_9RHOB|nr:OmpA family protein [Amylibacter ulvae]GHA56115.1 hypothetical protein GCM10008927_22310 [Amylibacter ulvae]
MRLLTIITLGLFGFASSEIKAQSQIQLPIEASSCAIQNALTGALNTRCQNVKSNGTPRGIVLRLDQELNAQKAQDLGRTASKAPVVNKVTFKQPVPAIDRRAAKSNDGYFIQFAFASFQLEKQYVDHIVRLATVLSTPDMANTCIRVTGHTDTIGSTAYNKSLSEKRAVTVAKLLAEKSKISPDRIQIISAGETQPLLNIDGHNPLNRRVEFSTKDASNGCE